MKTDPYDKLYQVFSRAHDLRPETRAAFLNEACRDDPDLRQEVESLLARCPPEPETATPAMVTIGPDAAGLRETHPDRIGPYRVLHELGRGGMGVVCLGMRDDDQFERRVAIKVLKRGMDTEQVQHRFQRERQLLAALNHPNIARLYDGGETEDGRSYFAMEHVEGVPLDEYCDRQRLPIATRLDLFRQVCLAVHYAHQNLVVHRDLKPHNILVTSDGVPKLLDFGIAKVINPDLSAAAGDPTLPEFRVMTPEYASPEQVRGDPITTASDIYSLGVMLYELVSGHRPYRFESRGRSDIERVICEVEPQRPSTAVTRVEETDGGDGPDSTGRITPESVSRTREGRPDRLRKRLRGDIDNIVLMAMRKEPSRRYSSAEQLAEDIRRHQEGMPVIARPATLGYRCTKFVRRHRAGVAAAALVVVSLVAGIVGTSWQARVAARERDLAEQARRAEARQRGVAEFQRDRAERMFGQVRELAHTFMFDFHEEIQQLDGSLPARKLLVTTALKYLDGLAEDVGDDAELKRDMASAYDRVGDILGGIRNPSLGDTTAALEHYRTGLQLRRELVTDGSDDPSLQLELSASYRRVGDMHRQTGNLAGAREAYAETTRIREQLAARDPKYHHPLGTSLNDYAGVLARVGELEEARTLYERSLSIFERLAAESPGDPRVRRTLSVVHIRIGDAASRQGDLEAALRHFDDALGIRRRLVDEYPDSGRYKRDLSVAHYFAGEARLDAGEPERALDHAQFYVSDAERRVEANAEDARTRFDLATGTELLGRVFEALDDPDAASDNYTASRLVLEGLVGHDPENVTYRGMLARVRAHLGDVAAAAGEPRDAEGHYRAALMIAEELTRLDPQEIRWQTLRSEQRDRLRVLLDR